MDSLTIKPPPPIFVRGVEDFSEATSGQNNNLPSPSAAPDTNNSMSSFLQEFKALINPPIALLTKSAAWSSNSHTHHPLNQTSVPSDIRILIADKRRARALFQRNRLPSLKHNYNKLSNLLKKMLAKYKASVLENFLTNLSPNDGSLWRATKRTYKLSSQNIPIKKSDGSFVCTDLDKAE
ncbi:hypothetical protein QTP88_022282 [Uroleucon formosanum]